MSRGMSYKARDLSPVSCVQSVSAAKAKEMVAQIKKTLL